MLKTERLILRQWKESDLAPFVALNQDADVMEYFPSTYTEQEVRASIDYCENAIASAGWGFWAVDECVSGEFIGMVGLNKVPDDLPISHTHEVGWRLSKRYWGKGYATEAAMASLDYAFLHLNLMEVVAFTPVANKRSRRVMEKLGMSLQTNTFEHPRVPADSSLRTHVLYRIGSSDFSVVKR